MRLRRRPKQLSFDVDGKQIALGSIERRTRTVGDAGIGQMDPNAREHFRNRNRLCDVIDATGFQPGYLIVADDPSHQELLELSAKHVVSLKRVLAQPSQAVTLSIWQRLRAECHPISIEGDSEPTLNGTAYTPLALSAADLRGLAIVFRRIAMMARVAAYNFAGVVRDHAKDPHNLPTRLALVVAYQWAREMKPPMGYDGLAKTLIDYEVVDGKWWGDDRAELAGNIKSAVRKFRRLMPISTMAYAPPNQPKGGTTPP